MDMHWQANDIVLRTIACFCSLNKVEGGVFERLLLGSYVSIWGLSDRTLRTSLLGTLKAIAPLVPDDVVNKKIFDLLIGGFSDSNAK